MTVKQVCKLALFGVSKNNDNNGNIYLYRPKDKREDESRHEQSPDIPGWEAESKPQIWVYALEEKEKWKQNQNPKQRLE